jgi:AcrR family transcriptional regulator
LWEDDQVETSTPVGLRARNRERKHDRIRTTALAAFGDRGFDDVTVEEIAEQAEVSRSTLFRYFPTKEDLVLLDDSARLDALQGALVGRPADEPVLASLRAALVALAGAYQGDRDDLVASYRIIRATPALMARTLEQQAAREDALAAALEERLDGDDVRARALAATGMALVRVALRAWLAAGPDTVLADVVAETLDLLIADLAP